MLKYSGIVTPYIMFTCAVCRKIFKNHFELRAHTKTCVMLYSSQPATMILPNLQPSNHDHNDVPLIEMGDIYNTLLENAQSSTTADVLPPVLDWRCAVPVIDTVPQSLPTRFDSRIFNYHEVLIARDVRKHEKSLPWTNTNYSLLSQVVNSLSLSQSDTDRLLNAVIYLYIASATTLDHRYTVWIPE